MILADLELEHKKLHNSNFCKNRFCLMCNWRMTLKDCLAISVLMEHLLLEENKEFIFGYIRKLEITYQGEKYIIKKLWNR